MKHGRIAVQAIGSQFVDHSMVDTRLSQADGGDQARGARAHDQRRGRSRIIPRARIGAPPVRIALPMGCSGDDSSFGAI
jgi:hypothetical protein